MEGYKDHWQSVLLRFDPLVLPMALALLMDAMRHFQTVPDCMLPGGPAHHWACWRGTHRRNYLPVRARSRTRNSHNALRLEEATSHIADTIASVYLQKVGSLKT